MDVCVSGIFFKKINKIKLLYIIVLYVIWGFDSDIF